VVLINFFFTSCSFICQMQVRSLAKVQDKLGDHLGKDVFLVSISMDPQIDTPDRLKTWSRNLGIRPGWTLVTSDTQEMKRMIEAFTGNQPGPQEAHDSAVFIGNDRTGQWMATDGLGGTGGLVNLLNSLSSNRVERRN
jgi:cytochrome oxidase Cu insertion factor (SCO1/SenC/PrrC family)